jgi:Skp family chaperone for outer membrane proteins
MVTPGHCPSINPNDTEPCVPTSSNTELDELSQVKEQLRRTQTDLETLGQKYAKLKNLHEAAMEEVRVLKQYKKRHESHKRKHTGSENEEPIVKRPLIDASSTSSNQVTSVTSYKMKSGSGQETN